MATSPIYSWPEPDNTDLVKNGALAIRTLGNAIDTTMATMTPKSIVDAKGDLIAASANDTPARLAVGANGEYLVADSTTATGLRYSPNYAAGKNALINGAIDVSQRGATITSINLDGTYTADRWYITRGGSIDYAQKTIAGGNNPPANFNAYAQYINQSAGNAFVTIEQTLETKDSLRFANQVVTFSFYARAAANTAKSKSLKASVTTNTSADTKTNVVLGNSTFALNFGTAATDWVRCTLTATVPSTAKSVGVRLVSDPAGGLAVGDGYEITGLQLENGSVATQFETATGTFQGELAVCQRYFLNLNNANTNTLAYGSGWFFSTTSARYLLPTPVMMRSTPTLTGALVIKGAATSLAPSTYSLNLLGSGIGIISAVVGGVQDNAIAATLNTTLTLDAEL